MRQFQRLDSVADITMGQAPAGESYNVDGNGIPLIAGAGDFGEVHPTPKKHTTALGKNCQTGDIILGIRATIGEKVLADRQYCLGRGVAGIRARPGLDGRYLWHWLTHAAPSLATKARGGFITTCKLWQATALEAIEKFIQRYQHARDMKETAIDLNMTVPAHHQATKIAHPGKRPFDLPTALVTAQLATVLQGSSLTVSAMRTDQINAP